MGRKKEVFKNQTRVCSENLRIKTRRASELSPRSFERGYRKSDDQRSIVRIKKEPVATRQDEWRVRRVGPFDASSHAGLCQESNESCFAEHSIQISC